MPILGLELSDGLSREAFEAVVRDLLEVLCRHNGRLLAERPRPKRLLESPVRYQRESENEERWRDIGVVLREGYGDCEDLSCALVAELRAAGKPAEPLLERRRRRDGRPVYHVTVLTKDRVLDPSIALGARAP